MDLTGIYSSPLHSDESIRASGERATEIEIDRSEFRELEKNCAIYNSPL